VEPLGECKTPLEIASGLAKHLGIPDFGKETEDELLRKDAAQAEVPDYDEFKEKGVYKIKLEEPYVAFQKQIEDPVKNPFQTDSGKIEIFSKKLAEHGDPLCPPVAKYIETWESRNDPLIEKYPLQLISTHFKRRTHGQYDRVPWLRELEPQALSISITDAKPRDIKTGDMVRIFNDRGQVVIQANVTERILPGVVDLPQGAWYDPDKSGIDRGGNPNVLTRDQASPGGSFPYNTCLVQVEVIEEKT
jgi:anaerobic dimethyl sulfoxide reductase subunit A